MADSGRSIFLEQSVLQRGQPKHFRWEIPYQYIVRIEENAAKGLSTAEKGVAGRAAESTRAAAAAVPLLPLTDKPKIA